MSSFSNTYQGLPLSYFYHSVVRKWEEETFRVNQYPFPEEELFSRKGVRVRSKSEQSIANELESNEIPYRYEAELILEGRERYPDFHILEPFTGRLIIWEHFGATHLERYENSLNGKMERYLRNAYVPFDNFIYTFEFHTRNTARIRELIEEVMM